MNFIILEIEKYALLLYIVFLLVSFFLCLSFISPGEVPGFLFASTYLVDSFCCLFLCHRFYMGLIISMFHTELD